MLTVKMLNISPFSPRLCRSHDRDDRGAHLPRRRAACAPSPFFPLPFFPSSVLRRGLRAHLPPTPPQLDLIADSFFLLSLALRRRGDRVPRARPVHLRGLAQVFSLSSPLLFLSSFFDADWAGWNDDNSGPATGFPVGDDLFVTNRADRAVLFSFSPFLFLYSSFSDA